LRTQIFIVALYLLIIHVSLWSQQADTALINASNAHALSILIDSPETARKICLKSLKESLKCDYLEGQGDALIRLGIICRNELNYSKSYLFLNQALSVRRQQKDVTRESTVLMNISINYFEENKYDSAIYVLNQAIQFLELQNKIDYSLLGGEYLLMSNILEEFSEDTESLRYAEKSIWALQQTSSKNDLNFAFYALANRYLQKKSLDTAFIYFNKAAENLENSPADLADIMTNKGIIYMIKGDFVQSAKCYQRAEEWLQQAGDEADYFHYYFNKSRLYFAQNQWAEGLQLLQKAIPPDWDELDCLDQVFLMTELADAYQHLEQYDSAYHY